MPHLAQKRTLRAAQGRCPQGEEDEIEARRHRCLRDDRISHSQAAWMPHRNRSLPCPPNDWLVYGRYHPVVRIFQLFKAPYHFE